MTVDAAIVSPVSAVLWALIGGRRVAIYPQRSHDRLQYFKQALVFHDDFSPCGAEPHPVGVVKCLRLFAALKVVSGVESVLRASVETELKHASVCGDSAQAVCLRAPLPILF